MEYYLALKKEGNSIVSNNMVKACGHNAKWNKPVTHRQILHDSTCMSYLK